MQWATNHAIQDESSYSIDGGTFRNYDGNGHGTVTAYDALRQSFNIPALKTGNKLIHKLEIMQLRNSHQKLIDYQSDIGPDVFLVVALLSSHLLTSICFQRIANGTYNNAHSIQKL